MKVIPIGTKIKTVVGGIDGIITGISIRGQSYVSYAISYFHNGEYSEIWVMPFEFTINTSTTVGFLKEEQKEVTMIDFEQNNYK